MEQQELSAAALAAIDKVTKLLALAKDKSATQGEVENAMSRLWRSWRRAARTRPTRMRSVMTRRRAAGGGLYKWQRTVWQGVSKLNMCVYFSIRGLAKGEKYENRLVGRPENVIMATVMGEYLQQTIERMAAEWAKERGYNSRFVREAVIYREGMAAQIDNRLWYLRHEREEAARKAKEEAKNQPTPETGTALTLVDVLGSEQDLNEDYLNGWEPGTTAQHRRDREASMNKWRAEQAILQATPLARMDRDPVYRAEHEALAIAERKADEARQKKYNRSSRSNRSYSARETAESRRRQHSAFSEGYEAAESISLNRQVDKAKQERIG